MKTEFEIRILEINPEIIIKKLEKLGAKKIIERNMKRMVYDFKPKQKGKWIRLRDDGQKNTITVKEITNDSVSGTKEFEIEIESFEKGKELLEKLEYKPKAYQENKRTSYELDKTEIDIDAWPKIPPYLEIESDSEKKVWETVKKLGYKKEQTTGINNIKIYEKYGIDLEKIRELKF